MKHSEYLSQMKRLKDVYGVVKYPQERVDIIFEHVSNINIDIFHKQISFFIGSRDKAPMLNDFIEALGTIMGDSKREAQNAKLAHLMACLNCSGTGHVTMYEKKTGFEFAFQCTCERGQILQPSFPKQYPNMGDDYASHRAWAAGRYEKIKR